jgi:hypothetical protein
MRKSTALAVVLTLGSPLATPVSAFAQAHSSEDEAACTPDVLRLCQQYIPRRPEIIACLVANKSELGPACHEVFSRSAQKPQESRRPPRKPVSQSGGNLY